ncbi:hypothetical protein BT69DRAFT_1352044 [Atractiella rhizophila]|nr:hypothetical protein BT69DRAFT_1352044 [Atractiella rhizophila]
MGTAESIGTSESPSERESATALPQKRKKEHATLIYACDFCRSIKRKCMRLPDKEKPECEACNLKGVECVFTPRKKKKLNGKEVGHVVYSTCRSLTEVGHSERTTVAALVPATPVPQTRVGKDLFAAELQAELTVHLLECAFRYSPRKVTTEVLDIDPVREFHSKGRDPRNMGRWGPLLISVLIADGVRVSTHPAILKMKAPSNPSLIGDMSTYARQRERAVQSLTDRVWKLCTELEIFRHPSVETATIILECTLLFMRSYTDEGQVRAKEAQMLFKEALAMYRMIMQTPDIRESYKESVRSMLGRVIVICDVVLAKHYNTQVTISDDELRTSMFKHCSFEAPYYLSAVPLLCTVQPTAEALASDEFLDISVAAFGRTSADLTYHAMQAPDQQTSARLFDEALKTSKARQQWLATQREARNKLNINKEPSPRRLVDLVAWKHNEIIEYPHHLFSCYSKLQRCVEKLDEKLEEAMLKTVMYYEQEVDIMISLLSTWCRDLVFGRTLLANDFDARFLYKICWTITPLMAEDPCYFSKYLTNVAFDPTIDRRQNLFWIIEALKAASFFKSGYAIWAIELTALLEEDQANSNSQTVGFLTNADSDAPELFQHTLTSIFQLSS